MKITFILPAIGKKKGKPYIKTWQIMEPLTISTLNALTPKHVETEFYDDRIELIDYNTETDLVAITTEIYTARRAYMIADRFRKNGKKVVLGGYHTTLCPDEASKHADSIVTGNAESIWSQVVEDFKKGTYKKIYKGTPKYMDLIPDRSVFKGKKYSKMGVIETGRGCNYSCEFCAISAFHGAKYHQKPVEQVVKDIQNAKKAGKRIFFFVDDNIVANHDYAIKLFKAITPLKINWTGQGTLTMANNPELLKWMKKSGCSVILIGYESLDIKNLKQMNKVWNSKLGETEELTQKVQNAGLSIYATFVFGFDNDTPELFDRTVAFAKKQGFFFAAFNHLLTLPGTKLYDRLLKENKIIEDKWWLSKDYKYGELTFNSKVLTADKISELCTKSRAKFYTIPSIFSRSLKLLQRSKDPILFAYFWYLNLQLGEEVEGKMGLPMGDNLDELPKEKSWMDLDILKNSRSMARHFLFKNTKLSSIYSEMRNFFQV